MTEDEEMSPLLFFLGDLNLPDSLEPCHFLETEDDVYNIYPTKNFCH